MALIKCPECGKQISDKSNACPYCGLPSAHYTRNKFSKLQVGAPALIDCAVIKSLFVKYPALLSPIADIHDHLVSLGFVLEEDIDRVKYYVDGKQKLQIYPSRIGGNSITIQFIGRDKTSTILLTPSSNLQKTKQFISSIAQKEGLPISGFSPSSGRDALKDLNAKELKNILISFDQDHTVLFSSQQYIDTATVAAFNNRYEKYYKLLENELVYQYVRTNALALQIDDIGLNRFLIKTRGLSADVEKHNGVYIDAKLIELKDYFEHIMDDIDPNINLDEEQRRAVITDDNHCLLVAGAGAGKTTTMAAKVKYLVEKQNVAPQDIIVISYTNKAVNELKERINKGLKIPAKIATFHSFAFDIVRKAHEEPPEINISSYNIIYDMLAKQIFDNKQLMKNLVLFMGYYFDLPEDIFQFRSLNEYHLYKSALDYETLKSGLGEYVQKIAYKRSRTME
jgi:hypothetical protein